MLFVARPAPCPIEAGQIARTVILIEIELHAPLIAIDTLLEIKRLVFRRRRVLEESLVPAAKQPEALRRRSRKSNQPLKLRDRIQWLTRVRLRKGVDFSNLLLVSDIGREFSDE